MELFVGIILILAIPVLLIVLLAKGLSILFTGGSSSSHQLTEEELQTSSLSLIAGLAGVGMAYALPEALYTNPTDSEAFLTRLIVAVVFIAMGYFLKDLLGTVLLTTGVLLAAMQTPFIFSNFGDSSTFVVLVVAFIALIVLGVRYGRKQEK